MGCFCLFVVVVCGFFLGGCIWSAAFLCIELEFFNISVAFCMIISIQFVMMCVPFVAREGSASTAI